MGYYEALFNEMVRVAMEKGVQFGSIQTVDSVHTVANVNLTKDRFRQEKKNKPPRDKDASWGVKRIKKVKQADGTLKEEKESFYGYKTHVSTNAKSGIVTSIKVTVRINTSNRSVVISPKANKRWCFDTTKHTDAT